MSISFQALKKFQDEDLVTALARRKADEEGRLGIVRAFNDQTTARANESIRRDNAATASEYRKSLIEERGLARESADRQRTSEIEKRDYEVGQERASNERINDITTHPENYTPEEVGAARALRIGIKTGAIPRTTKEVWRTDRQKPNMESLGTVGKDDVVQMEAPPPTAPKVSVTMPESGLSPNQESLIVDRLSKRLQSTTKDARQMLTSFRSMEDAYNEYTTKGMARDPAGQSTLVTFQKILDPISVVRESEYARSAEGQPISSKLEGLWQGLTQGGPHVSDAALKAYVDTARIWAQNAQAYYDAKKHEVLSSATRYKIPHELVIGEDTPMTNMHARDTPANTAAPGAGAPPQGGYKVGDPIVLKDGRHAIVTGIDPSGKPKVKIQ